MAFLCKRWDSGPSRFGDLAVAGFLLAQALDGALTYFGVSLWGANVEANPLVSSVVGAAGLGVGLTAAKLVAVACGIALHLGRIHNLVALLTAIYVAAAIIPWSMLLLLQ